MKFRIKRKSTIPNVVPQAWQRGRVDGNLVIYRDYVTGLRALYSIELISARGDDNTFLGTGEYRHISFSRKDRYPGWDEMKREILECGLFDRSKDVVMCLPPEAEYVNEHPYCFHWWQKV